MAKTTQTTQTTRTKQKTITRTEYLQLEGLAALAKRYYLQTEECLTAMQEMLGLEFRDHLADVVFTDLPLGNAIAQMGITTADEVKAADQPGSAVIQ